MVNKAFGLDSFDMPGVKVLMAAQAQQARALGAVAGGEGKFPG